MSVNGCFEGSFSSFLVDGQFVDSRLHQLELPLLLLLHKLHLELARGRLGLNLVN